MLREKIGMDPIEEYLQRWNISFDMPQEKTSEIH